jgi:hypothetical protein
LPRGIANTRNGPRVVTLTWNGQVMKRDSTRLDGYREGSGIRRGWMKGRERSDGDGGT